MSRVTAPKCSTLAVASGAAKRDATYRTGEAPRVALSGLGASNFGTDFASSFQAALRPYSAPVRLDPPRMDISPTLPRIENPRLETARGIPSLDIGPLDTGLPRVGLGIGPGGYSSLGGGSRSWLLPLGIGAGVLGLVAVVRARRRRHQGR